MTTRSRYRLRTIAALLAALAGSSCVSLGSVPNPFARSQEPDVIWIEVRNLNWHDARLHVIRGAERERLGTVTGKSDATYTMEWPQTVPLRLEIDLIAAGWCTTYARSVSPGEVVPVQIENELEMDPDCERHGTQDS